jgi:hypothetical protein
MGKGLEKMLDTAQEKEEKEHSKEWLDSFSQEVEKGIVAALKLKQKKNMEVR